MIENNKINWVCMPCGVTANYLTCLKKFGQRPHKPAYDVSTWHRGTCDVCKSPSSMVTEPRDFFYPDFTLIEKVNNVFHKKTKTQKN